MVITPAAGQTSQRSAALLSGVAIASGGPIVSSEALADRAYSFCESHLAKAAQRWGTAIRDALPAVRDEDGNVFVLRRAGLASAAVVMSALAVAPTAETLLVGNAWGSFVENTKGIELTFTAAELAQVDRMSVIPTIAAGVPGLDPAARNTGAASADVRPGVSMPSGADGAHAAALSDLLDTVRRAGSAAKEVASAEGIGRFATRSYGRLHPDAAQQSSFGDEPPRRAIKSRAPSAEESPSLARRAPGLRA